jgi:hypothetical protein
LIDDIKLVPKIIFDLIVCDVFLKKRNQLWGSSNPLSKVIKAMLLNLTNDQAAKVLYWQIIGLGN